jgi:hypothetical protein
VPDIFNLDTLIAQMVLALGAALMLGNGYALVMDRWGVRPKDTGGELRRGRAVFLTIVGAVMTYWGIISLTY